MTLIEAVRKYLVTENSNVLTDVKLKSDEVKVALKYKEEDENVKDNKHSDDEICEDFVKEEIPVKLNISKQSNIRKIQVKAENYKSLLFKKLCRICWYNIDHDMADHEQTHFMDGNYNCPFCAFVSPDKCIIMEHTIEHRDTYLCTHCDYKAKFIHDLTLHYKEIHKVNCNNNLECFICKEEFETKSQVRHHIERAHNSSSHICYICNKKFNQFGLLRGHMEVHNQRDKYTCHICGKKYNAKNTFDMHMELHDNSEEKFPCSVCDKKFASKLQRKNHMISHRSRDFLCNICDFACNSNGNLKRHIRTVHTDERPYQCTYCDYSSKTEVQLRKHTQLTHTEPHVKDFECQFCGKKFRTKMNKKTHEKIHTGTFDAHCDICNKSFVQSYNHKIHMMKQHSIKV